MDTFDPKHIYSDAAKLARLKDKKLFLFDIDGTIAVGDTLYEGSADLLRYIQAIGGRSYYITNNSTKSGLDYVKKFHDAFHLDSTEDHFITSGYMTLRFLKENYADKKIFVLGTASFVAELRKNGLWVTEVCEDPGCSFLRHQPGFALPHRLRLYPRLRCHLQHDHRHHRQTAHLSGQAQQRGRKALP